ncbi:hypothetical protein HAX54_020925, partial [Datura stramonium]|nr:hypothetical protein [Datura stramonium]
EPNHELPDKILLEKFYIVLDALTQFLSKTVVGGCFMDKTFNIIDIILDKITKHNHAWHGGDSFFILFDKVE